MIARAPVQPSAHAMLLQHSLRPRRGPTSVQLFRTVRCSIRFSLTVFTTRST